MPGPARFWPAARGEPPTAQVIVSPRRVSASRPGPRLVEVPVDAALLAAGDHNGSTFYKHRRFVDAVRGRGAVEVTVDDGWKAVAMGMAAQRAARTGTAVTDPFTQPT